MVPLRIAYGLQAYKAVYLFIAPVVAVKDQCALRMMVLLLMCVHMHKVV